MNDAVRLVLATRNAGKVREFGRLLGEMFVVEVLPAEVDMPEETGQTFADNARLKATSVFQALRETTAVLADDSGLEVVALGNRPGVLSARYAGEKATDEDNVLKLLTELEAETERAARFVCCLCLILPPSTAEQRGMARTPKPAMFEVQGVAEGLIERTPRGAYGFGYDPVFRPIGWRETLAEASALQKDQMSHRGAAVRALLEELREHGLVVHGS